MLDKNSIIEQLLCNIPEIKTKYQEEMAWWGNEEFPGLHNILGDVMNSFVVNLLKSSGNEELKSRIFSFYEDMAISSDYHIRNVLEVTLLEYLGDDKEILNTAYNYMGIYTKRLSDGIERYLGRKK